MRYRLWHSLAAFALIGAAFLGYARIRATQEIDSLQQAIRTEIGVIDVGIPVAGVCSYPEILECIDRIHDCRAGHRACLQLLNLLESSDWEVQAKAAYAIGLIHAPALRTRSLAVLHRVAMRSETDRDDLDGYCASRKRANVKAVEAIHKICDFSPPSL